MCRTSHNCARSVINLECKNLQVSCKFPNLKVLLDLPTYTQISTYITMSTTKELVAKIVYTVLPIGAISDEILKKCAVLFSEHYGTWSSKEEDRDKPPPGVKGGSRVRFTSSRLRKEYLFNDQCGLCTATLEGELLCHDLFTKFAVPEFRSLSGYYDTLYCISVQYVESKIHRIAAFLSCVMMDATLCIFCYHLGRLRVHGRGCIDSGYRARSFTNIDSIG